MNEGFEISDRVLIEYQGKDSTVIIPDEIVHIEPKAFSFCDNLKTLIIPKTLESIGNFALPTNADINVSISCAYHIPQPIPLIGPISLYLKDETGYVQAILFIPDFHQQEPYQQFVNRLSRGQVEYLSEYDELFYQSEQIIIHKVKIALNRLLHPLELDDKYRQRYIKYLRKHAHIVVPKLIESSNNPMISILAEIDAMLPDHIDAYIDQASKLPEIETLAVLMNYKDKIRDQLKPLNLEIEETHEKQSLWEFEQNEDGTLTLTRYHGDETEVTIPSSIDGRRVTRLEGSIGSLKVSIFHPNPRNVHTIIIEEGIEEIGKRAFLDCVNLVSVTIPTSVKVLGEEAFAGCSRLALRLPETNKAIGRNAFFGIKELGINSQKPPLGLENIGLIGLTLNLLDEEGKTYTKLYIPNFHSYGEDNPYIEFVRLLCKGGGKDLSEFDGLFTSEGIEVFGKGCVALYRLEYPQHLLKEYQEFYTEFLLENEHLVIPTLIRRGDLSAIKGLAKLNLICQEYLDIYIEEARDHSNEEIAELLVDYQKQIVKVKEPAVKKISTISSPDEWVIFEDCIQAYKGNQLIVIFPSEINGQKIKRIEYGELGIFDEHSEHVINVIVEEGIEFIGEIIDGEILGSLGRVFWDCRNLKHVYFPSSLRKIHYDAFWGCDKVVIHAPKGSYAIKYARYYGIKYVET